jgi:hypothetical protein
MHLSQTAVFLGTVLVTHQRQRQYSQRNVVWRTSFQTSGLSGTKQITVTCRPVASQLHITRLPGDDERVAWTTTLDPMYNSVKCARLRVSAQQSDTVSTAAVPNTTSQVGLVLCIVGKNSETF